MTWKHEATGVYITAAAGDLLEHRWVAQAKHLGTSSAPCCVPSINLCVTAECINSHLVRMILTSVTSPLAAKCSLNRASSTYLGKFLTHSREVAVGGGGWGAEVNAAAEIPSFMVSSAMFVAQKTVQLGCSAELAETELIQWKCFRLEGRSPEDEHASLES